MPVSSMPRLFQVPVTGVVRLTQQTFEIRFRRPQGYNFLPGQKLELVHGRIHRDYTLITTPDDAELAICVRLIARGRLSPVLAGAEVGQIFTMSAPFGFFLFQPSPRPAVFVATGTGIAPFVAFARSGVREFHMIHGVRTDNELYYHDILSNCAGRYTPCISSGRFEQSRWPDAFPGRVTVYLENRLDPADYDFYLCGRGDMVRDAVRIIDRRFPSARVFTETFF